MNSYESLDNNGCTLLRPPKTIGELSTPEARRLGLLEATSTISLKLGLVAGSRICYGTQVFRAFMLRPAAKKHAERDLLFTIGEDISLEFCPSQAPENSLGDGQEFMAPLKKAKKISTNSVHIGFANAGDSEAIPESKVSNRNLDSWAHFLLAPTEKPFELKPKGYVCRGMRKASDAVAYAEEAKEFFLKNNLVTRVFVIKGPTKTTRAAWEVVTESCGYDVVHEAKALAQTYQKAALNEVAHTEQSGDDIKAGTNATDEAPRRRIQMR